MNLLTRYMIVLSIVFLPFKLYSSDVVIEYTLPDGAISLSKEDRQKFLEAYVALTIRNDLMKGNTEMAIQYFQQIIDRRSEEIGYDFEGHIRSQGSSEQ